MNLAVLKNISLKFGEQSVLDDISLTFKKEQITTIIGPNGGGKSSLIKLILGIIKPTSGRVFTKKNLKIG